VALLLAATQLAACSTAAQPAQHSDNVFLQAFEATQIPSDAGQGSWELILVRRDDAGKMEVFRSGPEGMDRLVYVWGEKGPAVPLFFSPRGAMRFALYQASALGDAPSLTAAALDERAWRQYRDSADKKANEKEQQ